MLFGSLLCRRRRSGASRPRDTFRIGSRVGRSSNLVMRLLAPVLIVIVVAWIGCRALRGRVRVVVLRSYGQLRPV